MAALVVVTAKIITAYEHRAGKSRPSKVYSEEAVNIIDKELQKEYGEGKVKSKKKETDFRFKKSEGAGRSVTATEAKNIIIDLVKKGEYTTAKNLISVYNL